MKTKDKSKRGKLSRAAGQRFETKVRKDLEEKGWIVDKWTNNVEFDIDKLGNKIFTKLIPAKHKFRGIGIPMAIGTGFPDFIAFKQFREPKTNEQETKILNHKRKVINYIDNKFGSCSDFSYQYIEDTLYPQIIGVEVKSNGYLDKTEREKCRWYLENKIFSKILIAYKVKEGRKIIIKYKEFNLNGKNRIK